MTIASRIWGISCYDERVEATWKKRTEAENYGHKWKKDIELNVGKLI